MQKLLAVAVLGLGLFGGMGSAIASPNRECPKAQEIKMVAPTENSIMCINPQGTIDAEDDIASLYMYDSGIDGDLMVATSMMQAGSVLEYAFLIADNTTGELDTLAFSASVVGDEVEFGDPDGNAQLFIDREGAIAALINLHSHYNFR